MYKFIYATFLTVFTLSLQAQTYLKQWDRSYGGNNFELESGIEQTDDGGYILTGQSASGISGDKSQASQGSNDYWIIKTNSSGVKQWDAAFGGNSDDQLTCVRKTKDGGYILGGQSYSGVSGDKSQPLHGDYDYWVVKVSSNGVKQWDADFGGNGFENIRSIIQTKDNGYLLGGTSFSGLSGDKSQNSFGSYDYWVVKLDSNGTKQWDAAYGGNDEDRIFSMLQTADSGYVLAGYSSSGISGNKTLATKGGKDYWIVKINTTGAIQWQWDLGGNGDDNLTTMLQTSDGGFLFGGSSYSGVSGDKSQAANGDKDCWIVKTDSLGNKLWDASFGGNGADEPWSIQVDKDGGYAIGVNSHSTASSSTKTSNGYGYGDYWLIKTDTLGNEQWDADFGGTGNDELRSMVLTDDTGYILAGYSASGISYDKSQASQGSYDFWIIKVKAFVQTWTGATSNDWATTSN